MIIFLNKKRLSEVLLTIVLGFGVLIIFPYTNGALESIIRPLPDTQKSLESEIQYLTALTAQDTAKALIPIVESFAGKRFKKLPEIKMVSRIQLEKIYLADLIHQLKRVMPFHNEVNMIEMANLEARKMSKLILGKYGLVDEILYLVPENMSVFKKSNVVKSQNFESILKLIISHELTHVLQDQELDLTAKIGNLGSLEELEAFKATIEGHAFFVQEQIGKHLKLNGTTINSSTIASVSLQSDGESVYKLRDKVDQLSLEEIYFQGRNFIEYYFNKGGNKMVWQVLSRPPANTLMILKPATYAVQNPSRPNPGALLEGLERFYGNKNWEIENFGVPMLRLNSAFIALDQKEGNEAIYKISFMQILRILSKGDIYRTISVIRVKDENYSAKIISILQSIIRKSVDIMKQNPNFNVNNIIKENFIGMHGDILTKLSYRVKSKNDNDLQFVVVYICREELIIEVSGEISYLADDKIIKIAEEIFDRYNQAKSLSNSEGKHP